MLEKETYQRRKTPGRRELHLARLRCGQPDDIEEKDSQWRLEYPLPAGKLGAGSNVGEQSNGVSNPLRKRSAVATANSVCFFIHTQWEVLGHLYCTICH
jgi:hypothetical protein